MSAPNNEYLDYGQNKKMSSSSLIVSFTKHEPLNTSENTSHGSLDIPRHNPFSDDEIIEFLSQQISPKSVQFVQQISEDLFLVQLSKPKDAFKCVQSLNNSKLNGRTIQILQKTLGPNHLSLKRQQNRSRHYNKYKPENYSRYNSGDMAFQSENSSKYNTTDINFGTPHPSSLGSFHTNTKSFGYNSTSNRNDQGPITPSSAPSLSFSNSRRKAFSSPSEFESNTSTRVSSKSTDTGSIPNSNFTLYQKGNSRNSSRSQINNNHSEHNGKKNSQNSFAELQNSYPSFLDSFLLKQTYQNMFFQNYQYQAIPQSLSPIQLQQMNVASQYMPMQFYIPPSGMFSSLFPAMRSHSMPAIHNGPMTYPYDSNAPSFDNGVSKDSSKDVSTSEENDSQGIENEENVKEKDMNDNASGHVYSNSNSPNVSSSSAEHDIDLNKISESISREKSISPQHQSPILNSRLSPTTYNLNMVDADNSSFHNQQMMQFMYQMMSDSRNFCDPSISTIDQKDFSSYMYPMNNYYGDPAYYQKFKYYPYYNTENSGINVKNSFMHQNRKIDDCEESPDIHRLFFGNLSYKTTLEDLKKEIHQRLHSDEAKFLIEMPNSELTKGFAIVQFSDPTVAEHAIACFDGTEFHGRKITVRYDKYPSFAKRNRANRSTFQCYDGLNRADMQDISDRVIDDEITNQERDINSDSKEDSSDTEKSRNLFKQLAISDN